MVTRTRLNVTFYVQYIACLVLFDEYAALNLSELSLRTIIPRYTSSRTKNIFFHWEPIFA